MASSREGLNLFFHLLTIMHLGVSAHHHYNTHKEILIQPPGVPYHINSLECVTLTLQFYELNKSA